MNKRDNMFFLHFEAREAIATLCQINIFYVYGTSLCGFHCKIVPLIELQLRLCDSDELLPGMEKPRIAHIASAKEEIQKLIEFKQDKTYVLDYNCEVIKS